MKLLPFLALLPPAAAAWHMGLQGFPLVRTARPLVVYSPEAMFQQQRALMQRIFTPTSPHYAIADTKEKFHIDIDVPGLAAEDIQVNAEDEGRILSISGRTEQSDENYSYLSKFTKTFSLDPAIELDKVSASVKNGVLTIDAPKKDLAKLEEMIHQ